MKKLLLVGLVIASTAAFGQSGEWVARAPNQAGGQIVLLSFKGSCSNGLRMYSASNGNMSWGCWMATETHVMVLWDDGNTRTSAFEYGMWEMNPANKKPQTRHSM